MATEWHYSKGGQQHGPASAAELKALAKSGELLPTDMIWKEGMAEWKPAGSLKGLFPPTASTVPQKAPPPLPTASSVKNASLESTSEGENPSPFPVVWKYCTVHPVKCAAVGFGTFILLTLFVRIALETVGLDGLIPLFIFPMLLIDFVLFVLLAIFGVKAFLVVVQYENLVGKWNPHDGRGEPFQISGKSLTRGNSLVGTIAVDKDKRLEISSGGKVIEVWQLITVQPKELVFHNAAGEVKRYTKTVTNPLTALFKTNRVNHLQGSWQPINEENEWMQFTKDGAVVFSSGSAGRFTINGVEPNEMIELELVGSEARQFRIVSLTPDQLVIAEGDEATTFRRPKHQSVTSEKSFEASSLESDSSGVSMSSEGQRQYLDCPNCGKCYYVDQVEPSQRIDCSDCDKWFLVKDGLNLRTSTERVETKGFFQRLWSGSSIQRSNREKLESTAKTYQAIIRNEELKGNLQAAQLWQLRLNEVMRQLAEL